MADRALVEIGPVAISVPRLILAVWDAVQDERVRPAELAEGDADRLSQAASCVRTRLGLDRPSPVSRVAILPDVEAVLAAAGEVAAGYTAAEKAELYARLCELFDEIAGHQRGIARREG